MNYSLKQQFYFVTLKLSDLGCIWISGFIARERKRFDWLEAGIYWMYKGTE